MAEYRDDPNTVGTAETDGDHPNIWPFPVQDFGFKNYVVERAVFDKTECEEIIAAHEGNFPARRDRIIDSDPVQEHHYEVALLATNFAWVYERLTEYVLEVNRNYWRYSISGMIEPMRTIQHSPTDITALHCDHTEYDMAKIAWSVCIQPAKKGGRFFLATFGDIDMKAGDVCFFPSMMGHGVTYVEEGIRYQLAGWAAGPRFT